MAKVHQISSNRLRNIRKRLQQVTALEERREAGDELTEEQRSKVERKAELEAELEDALKETAETSEASTEASHATPPALELANEEQEEIKTIPAAIVDTQSSSHPKSRGKKLDVEVDEETLAWLQEGVEGASAAPSKNKKKKKAKASAKGKNEEVDKESEIAMQANAAQEQSNSAEPERRMERLTSEHWADDPAAIEDIIVPVSPKAAKVPMEFLENVQPFSPETQASQRMQRLVKATTDLSMQAFNTDVIEKISRKSKYRLTLIVKPEKDSLDNDGADQNDEDPWGGLLGFISYRLFPELQCVSVAKLAVVPESRGLGHGSRIIDWIISHAKKQKELCFISLSSLPTAIKFYKKIGFREVKDIDLDAFPTPGPEEDYVAGQVYMEYRIKGRRRPTKKR
eukprot:gnl/MRDRNA2_/MRDRNA2_105986_c0_seq1.p1 gnl/MRDRNA2_/MRDRNA2_105986_c0~~gnl/MRDRNA2_/MRDRNA2_105986_c0_seq1.p1  ORF type:complete len:399 (-),score=123.13 gnl/MRDRNA2_/MRDRNA2_105986_c0_seq1:407-1603(-)